MDMLARHNQKNSKNTGRSRLAKPESKVVPVRLSSDDLRRITAAAHASHQTVSNWIRKTVNAAVQD
jgi:predicted HicB family RNase H-like nuclease